ncbi:enoyl-CoA hydratase-related protein [Oceanobacillus damuensis]|uniref:enoyl-CoA hydratase-related protein n=1 Tax=Oceanobacillus damuensis TaxID=937928 RepID=UPI00082CA839|nr:enoyl-CoA hydratase-related protein [Oceanobacillus damuensis]
MLKENFLNELKYFKVSFENDNKILIVTINRPPINAFIKESYIELMSIINYVNSNESIGVMMLKSDVRLFSAGADTKRLDSDNLKQASIRRSILRKTISEFYNCLVPVICAVNGAAVGVGAVFAASSDIIIASDKAFFALPEIDVGLVGGAKGISRIFPPQKIRTMALTGKRIYAEEVYRYGGIEEIVPEDELYDKALEYAKTISDKGVYAVRKWKESFLITENPNSIDSYIMIEQCINQELVPFTSKVLAKE